jgi:hypothetical protein
MLQSLSARWRRLVNSLAYSALVAIVVGLGYLTFVAVAERRHRGNGVVPAESENVALVELSNFSARIARSSDAERLTVSLRARLTAPGAIDCYAYLVVRNDHVSPKLWAAWPTQGPGGAMSVGGHFNVSNPATGQFVRLTPSWTRITATFDHPRGQPPFETVMVYLVSARAEVLLSRPFSL